MSNEHNRPFFALTHSLAAKLLCEMWYLPTLIMLRSLLLLLLYRFFSQNWALWKELEKEFFLLFKVVRYDDFIHEIIMSFSLFYLSFSSIFYVLKWVRFSFIAMLHNLVCQFLPLSAIFSIALWLHPFSSFLIAWQIQANFIFLSLSVSSTHNAFEQLKCFRDFSFGA